jgi:hypothetical protein
MHNSVRKKRKEKVDRNRSNPDNYTPEKPRKKNTVKTIRATFDPLLL